MALTDCLKTALDGKEISQGDYERLVKRFEQLNKRHQFGATAGPGAPERVKQALLDELKAETIEKKRRAKLAIGAAQRMSLDIDGYRTPDGRKDVGEAALFHFEHNGEATYASVAGRTDEITGMAHAGMGALLERFRRSAIAGDKKRLNRAQLDNVVHEAFGEETGDAMAKGLAEAWADTAEWLRLRFNAAGGAIAKREKWGLPQFHDPVALRARGFEAWKADIVPLLDTSRMRHPLTDTPIAAGELDDVLEEVWTSIVTDGWNKRKPQMRPFGKGALAGRHAEHRFLAFKDADAWLRYQRDYGRADPFAAMMGHVNAMAHDIAAMEVLGPNPQATVEWLKQIVEKEAQLKAAGKPARFAGSAKGALDRAARLEGRIDAVWQSMRGTLATPVHGAMASAIRGVRNIVTSSVLGAASISAISDAGFAMVARRFAGVGGSVMGDYIKALTPAGRRDAVGAGLILDSARHVFAQQARYIGTLDGSGLTAYIADRVLTLSGLTPFTQAGRHAFGLAFMHEAAKQAEKGFDALHPLFRQKFEQYGIGAADWDRIRASAIHKGETGLTLLRPREIAASDEKLAERFLGMVQRETEYAVPSGTHRSRTVLLDQNRPGTVPGEILRTFAQFKSFGAVFAMLHGARTVRMLAGGERASGAAYAVAILLSSTFFGALALQLKQVAAGRDPRPMTSPEFWGASLLQGGGLGIYGDFLFADLNRYGGGLAASIGGAAAEHTGDFLNLTIGNLAQLAAGEKTNFGRELVQFARGNTPGGNIWYLRLAWERMVLDQAQLLLDPEADKAFRRKQRDWQRDFGQGHWWRPGQLGPDRAPDLGNMLAPVDQGS